MLFLRICMDGLTSKMMLLSIGFPGILDFCFVLLTDFPRLLPAHTFVDAVGCHYGLLADKIGIVDSSIDGFRLLFGWRHFHSNQVPGHRLTLGDVILPSIFECSFGQSYILPRKTR